ncbi:MAG: DUF86 domain-containing protein [Nanoarchaeota archaeon]|nr:DUF86 domain-containing protein [Nanoarchaeota archaeon]MBU4086337.1 DUF86 domain-containing protein [Nanoarchaeota archaeon]
MNKDSAVFIKHILESIENIEEFMSGVSEKEFIKNKEKQSAVIRQIEIIGEAVKNLPKEFTDKHPTLPWRDIAGMRDKVIHNYFGVDLIVILKTIQEDIPNLKKKILKIKEEL